MRRGSGRLASAFHSSVYLGVDARIGSRWPQIAAIELGLREQGADFWLAAGREQRQPVERAGQRAGLDRLAALAEPAGQLQPRIVVGAHEGEAVAGRAFRGVEGNDRQRAEFARQRLIGGPQRNRSERGGGRRDRGLRIGEAANLAARPVDFDHADRAQALFGSPKRQDVLAAAALRVARMA